MSKANFPGPGPSIQAPRGYPGRPITTPQEGQTTVVPANPDLPVSSDNIATLTPKTVPGLGDLWSLPDGTKDTYDADGKLTRRVGGIVLDGTEDWHEGQPWDRNGFHIRLKDAAKDQWPISSHFAGRAPNTGEFGTVYIDTGPDLLVSYDSTDLAVFKAFLAAKKAAGTPVIILYALAQPTTQYILTTGPIATQATDLAAPSWTGKSTLSGDPAPDHPVAITGVPFAATATGGDQTRTVDLGVTGYSLPDGTADTYDGRTGELVRRVGKIVLDGSETGWFIGNAGTQTNTIDVALEIGPIGNRYALSSHFASEWHILDTPHFYTWDVDGGWVDLFIPLSLLSAPTVEAAKTWLAAQAAAGTPVTVLYALASPIRTTRKADLQCFEGETTITGADRVEIIDGRVERVGGYLPYQCVRSNPDLLINTLFLINQRGQAVYNPAYGIPTYTLDCWKFTSFTGGENNRLAVGPDGIELYHSADGILRMQQAVVNPKPLSGRTVTFSMDLIDTPNPVVCYPIIDGEIGDGKMIASKGEAGIKTHTFVFPYCTNFEMMFQTASVTAGTTNKIRRVKLELGTESTLWIDLLQPPDPAKQLRECQRYFVRLPFSDKETIGNACYGTTWLNLQLALPIEMARYDPAVTITCAPTRVVDAVALPALGNVRVRGTNCNLSFKMQGTPGASYIFAGQAGYIDLSCEP